jgi:hypothetical protein
MEAVSTAEKNFEAKKKECERLTSVSDTFFSTN